MTSLQKPLIPFLPEPVVVWNGTLERASIQAQQRQPERTVNASPLDALPARVAACLQSAPTEWWTVRELAGALRVTHDTAYSGVRKLVERGLVERAQAGRHRGRLGQAQQYRWSA